MKRLAASFWLLTFCFYGVTGTGHSSFSDGYVIFLTARNLLSHGDLAVPPPGSGSSLTYKVGVDGRTYARFGPGMVLAHLPMLIVGRNLPFFRPTVDGKPASPIERDEFWAQLTNAWLMATIVTLILLAGVRLGFDWQDSLWVASAAAAASPLWIYARLDSTEALQALSLTGAAYFLIGRRDQPPSWTAAGALAGIGIAAKLANLMTLPWFALYCLMSNPGRRERAAALLRLLWPLIVLTALTGLYNFIRFGSILDTGYNLQVERFSHPLLDGVSTLLLSPSYGLVVFWPAFLLIPFGLTPFCRSYPREGLMILGIFLTLLVLYSQWWALWGVLWGPRFLVPALPLLSLLILPVVARARGWGRAVVLIVLFSGIAAQAIAVGCGFWTQVAPVWSYMEVRNPDLLFTDPRIAPLRVGAWWLRATALQYLGSEQSSETLLANPPWQPSYPWHDPAAALADLRRLRGLDLWAVPSVLRLKEIYLPPPRSWLRIPSNRRMRALLLAAASFAAFLVAREVRRFPDE